jgi:hypothetical protein
MARLRQLLAGEPVSTELHRRDRLEAVLDVLNPKIRLRLVEVARAEQRTELINTRFASLPPNVTLTSTSLHINFHGPGEFLQSVAAVVYALENDYPRIEEFLENGLSVQA